MINYVYAFICSVIFYVLIQYYINNYSSDDQKQVLNFGNNKILLFIGILLLFEGVLYLYTSNILKTFNTSNAFSMVGANGTSNTVSLSGASITPDKISMEDFETSFINSIKNQEVDVGVVPF